MTCAHASSEIGRDKPTRPRLGFQSLWGFNSLDWRHWVRTIVAIRATPRQIALGVALGAFIAFTPFIGLQTLIAALAATLVGASRKAAMLAVWISNPITMGPIFALTYQLGLVLGSPKPASATISGQILDMSEGSAAIMTGAGIGFGNLLEAGWGYLLPMTLGGAVIGLLAALMSYRLTHQGVLAYQRAYVRRLRIRSHDTSSG